MSVADRRRASTNKKPPRAPLAFRVGAVGYQPDRLDGGKLDELADTIRTILSEVRYEMRAVGWRQQWFYDGASPVLRAVSPLADRTDSTFAEQALSLGFELCAVLPFARAEFEKDFTSDTASEADSLNRFQNLLEKATTRFELDGTRAESAEARGQAGMVVLNQSDLLIVAWDGQWQDKRGGIEDIFDEARKRGVTVVWIDANEPRNWQLIDAGAALPRVAAGERVVPDGSGSSDRLSALVREILEIPGMAEDHYCEPHQSRGSHDPNRRRDEPIDPHDKPIDARWGLSLFYAERRPRFTLAVLWKMMTDVIGDAKLPRVRFTIDDFENAVREDWPTDDMSPIGRLVNRLSPFYAWPDGLAALYADRYRSAFAWNYLTFAFAVFLALLPSALGRRLGERVETACILFELTAILLILGRVWWSRRWRWRERWLDYRMAAELLRRLRMAAPLGGRRLLPGIPASRMTYGQPVATWMAWYVHAVERWLGLPTAVVDAAYLDEYLKQLEHFVIGQIRHHQTTEYCSHSMERRLHWAVVILLGMTLLACLAHLGGGSRPERHWLHALSPPLTFLCGFLPALAAALAAIRDRGAFRSLNNQSRAMRAHLRKLLPEIERLRDAIRDTPELSVRQYLTQAERLGRSAGDLVLNDVLNGRGVVFEGP